MNVQPADDAATRLCVACGLCCDGTLFEIVRQQEGESAAEWLRLGLRVQRQQGVVFMQQPCSALKDRCCSIYAQRPVRCRRFECKQLQSVLAGAIELPEALQRIHDAQQLIEQLRALLDEKGFAEPEEPLLTQIERALAQRPNSSWLPEQHEVHAQLQNHSETLREHLREHFRV
jgi:uncharacterized protein